MYGYVAINTSKCQNAAMRKEVAPGGVSGYARAWYFRSVSGVRAPPSAYSYKLLELFVVHKLTRGKRESVSLQHFLMKNQRSVVLLNPMRDKN